MRQVAIMLVLFLIAVLGSGCSFDQPQTPQVDQFINVPQKCTIELDPMPVIEPKVFQKGKELEQSKWAYGNYLLEKEDNQKIRAKIKKCQ